MIIVFGLALIAFALIALWIFLAARGSNTWLVRTATDALATTVTITCLGLVAFIADVAQAGGWSTLHKYVHSSGDCPGQEVLASYYWTGKRTTSGEAFNANGNTAAARSWPLGTRLTVTNPDNGRSISVRINDRGPYGEAWRQGARLDLARGAARRLGMSSAQYLCVN